MLSPKRTKFRKYQKGKIGGIKPNTNQLQFGRYGIKTIEPGLIKAKTIEAVRRVMTRKFKRTGQIWIRIFPDKTVTARAAESRMGSGKGAVDYWVAVVKPGTMIFEVKGVPEEVARAALNLAAYKLPIKTKFIIKDSIN